MAEWMLKLLVIGFAAWVLWSICQTRYEFMIRIEGGRPRVLKGRVTSSFVAHVAEVCQSAGVTRGWVGGVRIGRLVALRFSRHIPPGPRQQLRNEWLAAG